MLFHPYIVRNFSTPRFHKLAWSAHGQEGVNACGVIAGGSDNGTITLWAADKIIGSISSRSIPSSSHFLYTGFVSVAVENFV